MKPKSENTPTSTECIEYTRTCVPSSMRSQYWKYFGFPSDSFNNILTRQKIVCTLCGAAIAYNKNTSNLRTHLAAKHSDLLIQIIKNNATNSVAGQSTSANRKRRYSNTSLTPFEFIHDDSDSFLMKQHNFENANFVEMVEPVTQSDSKDLLGASSSLQFRHFDELERSTSPGSNDLDCEDGNDVQSYRLDELIVQKGKDVILASNNSSILDMLVTDLCSISIITGDGFKELYGMFCMNEINDLILNTYNEMDFTIRQNLEEISKTKPFSLGLECFTNCEQYELLYLYFNFYDSVSNEVYNVLYKYIDKDEFDFTNMTKDLKMKNCVCLILNNSNLEDLVEESDIPKFLGIDTLLTNCMRNIFNDESITKFFRRVYKATQHYQKEYNTMFVTPDVFPPCPWTKINFLQTVLDKIDLNVILNDSEDLTEFREFCEYIAPLKITIETIAEEELPFCTLIFPLVVKLVNEHFSIINTENNYIINIHKNIEDEFQKSVLSNSFLKESTFFDVRFQHDFINDPDERINIQNSILKRYKTHININKVKETSLKVEEESPTTSRKGALKLFFNRISESSGGVKLKANVQLPQIKTNIENEFEKYQSEYSIDLEHCPVQWWRDNSHKYPQLYKVSNYILSVPCCVTRLYRMDAVARVELLNKRYMLRQTREERYLWYLHYNKLYYNKLRIN